MRKLNQLLLITAIFMSSTSLSYGQWGDWIAPKDETDTLVNMYKHGDPDAIAGGKQVFATICFLCHGDHGKGDGMQAPTLPRPPADLTSRRVQKQTDGELFWKITNGNDVMLSFSTYTKEERWQLVTFIRQLAKDYPPATELDAEAKDQPSQVTQKETTVDTPFSWEYATIGTIVGVVMLLLIYSIFLLYSIVLILKKEVD